MGGVLEIYTATEFLFRYIYKYTSFLYKRTFFNMLLVSS